MGASHSNKQTTSSVQENIHTYDNDYCSKLSTHILQRKEWLMLPGERMGTGSVQQFHLLVPM